MHIYCNKLSLFCRLSTQEVSDSYKTKVHQIHKKKFVLYILTTHIYRWFECWCTTFWPCRVYNETNVCHSLLFLQQSNYIYKALYIYNRNQPYPKRGISHFAVNVLSTDIHQDVSRHVWLEYSVGPDDSITG